MPNVFKNNLRIIAPKRINSFHSIDLFHDSNVITSFFSTLFLKTSFCHNILSRFRSNANNSTIDKILKTIKGSKHMYNNFTIPSVVQVFVKKIKTKYWMKQKSLKKGFYGGWLVFCVFWVILSFLLLEIGLDQVFTFF